jgi:hypothetical protein
MMNMLQCAAPTHSNDKREEISPTCQQFINAKNIGLAHYKLIHQFKIGGFPDVTFALGTTQALFLVKFLYASSTPSNFTVFALQEQEQNSSNQQTDFLICHLIQEQGQKKSVDKIKASLKQAVHLPLDFVVLRTQLQLFVVALSIFFGKESVCTDKLKYLLLLVGHNKNSFCNQIVLDNFVSAKFLFTINGRVQRWLKMCEQVNNNVLNFDDLLDQVLNGSFQMNLPTSFKKIENSPRNAPSVKPKQANVGNEGEGNSGNRKKHKSKNRNGSQIKNSAQEEDFMVAEEGKTWKETFSKQFPHDRPTWEGKIKCAQGGSSRVTATTTACTLQATSQKTSSPQTRKQICSPS